MIKDRGMSENVSASTIDDGERMCIAGNAAKERYKQTEQTGRERVWWRRNSSRMQEDEKIDLHIMEADVLEGRYSCHELVNGNQP